MRLFGEDYLWQYIGIRARREQEQKTIAVYIAECLRLSGEGKVLTTKLSDLLDRKAEEVDEEEKAKETITSFKERLGGG